MFFKLRSEATLRETVELSGIGVHNGLPTLIRIKPSAKNTGIRFRRIDRVGCDNVIRLSPQAVVNPIMCTRITNGIGVSVAVIEHLLAAFRICGITNAEVEVNTDEIPIMDGSARKFVEAFKRSGTIYQNSFVPAVIISETISVSYKSASVLIKPAHIAQFSVKLDYDRINPVIGNDNFYSFTLSDNLDDIARARTFGWASDYDKVRSMGLAKGASEENTLVIAEDNIIKNAGGLRNPKEIVMHKCLDLIGDISIIGYDIIGKVECTNPSHYANNLLAKQLLNEIDKHEVITESLSHNIRCLKFA